MKNQFDSPRSGKAKFLATAAAGLLSANLGAQTMEDFVISEEAAKRTLNRAEISVSTAEAIAKACVAYAEDNDIAIALFVVGPSGNVIYAYRMDGQNPIAGKTALLKARTALDNRQSTRALAELPPRFLPAYYYLDQFPFVGGFPITVGDQLIGAIGVGGGSDDQEEECAYSALTSVIGPQVWAAEE